MEKFWLPGKRLPVCTLAAVILTVCSLHTTTPAYLGGTPGAYLRSPIGASAHALAGADTASPDYLASFHNPAVLGHARSRFVAVGTGFKSFQRIEGFGSFLFPISRRLGMETGVVYRADPIFGELHDAEQNIMENTSWSSLTAKIALGRMLTRKVSVGAAIGIYYENMLLPGFSVDDIQDNRQWSFAVGGFDIAVHYAVNDRLTFAGVVQNVNVRTDWQFSGNLGSTQSARTAFPIACIFGSHASFQLLERPLLWSSDMTLHLFDSDFTLLDHAVLQWDNGVEWQYWKTFSFRAGLGNLLFTRTLIADKNLAGELFAPRPCGGVSMDLGSLRKGLLVNYGLSINRIWAGVDQQLDAVLTF